MINKVPLKWRIRYGKVMEGKYSPGETAATPPEVGLLPFMNSKSLYLHFVSKNRQLTRP